MARRFRFITEEEHLKDLKKYQSFFEEMKCNYGKEIDIKNTGLTYKDFVDEFDIQNGSFRYLGSDKKNTLWVFNMNSVVEIETENIKQEETMKQYRFKTKEEFGRDLPIGWIPSMRDNIGKVLVGLDSQAIVYISQGRNFHYALPDKSRYSYSPDDVVEIKESQRIPKQDWEDINLNSTICGVEMQNGNKFYLLWNVDGFVPVNLKEHSSTAYSDTSDVEKGLDSMSETKGNKKLFKFETMEELIEWATS